MKTDLVGYYAKRAAEYERIYQKPERQADLARLHEFVASSFHAHDVLEISCGTGYWTQSLAKSATSVVACDINERVLEIARAKSWPNAVKFVRGDSYALPRFSPPFSAGFAAFWWSHVPKSRLHAFLAGFHARLRGGARVVFIDNRYVEGSSTPVTRTDAEGNTFQTRRLADGSAHEVIKNFPTPDEIASTVSSVGVELELVQFPYFWAVRYSIPPK